MCDPGSVKWIEKAFGECVITTRDKWSFGVGMVSNFMWIISSAPQIYQNCKAKKVDGQSPALFTLLFLGNILSLIGIVLTKGLITQIITSVLYVLLDGIMFAQFWWYGYIKPCIFRNKSECRIEEGSFEEEEEKRDNVDGEGKPIKVQDIDGVPVAGLGVALVQTVSATDWSAPYTGHDQIIGSVFGWVGGLVYIGSRVPQVIKNFQNRKVIDLSPIYVAFTIFGNVTYALSVFIKSIENDYLWKQTPFLFGAFGPMTCDILFTIQMCVFGTETAATANQKNLISTEEDEEGRRIDEL